MYLFLFAISSLALKLVASSIALCESHQLPCDNGWQCIERAAWCDRKNDCEDNSDEAYCKKSGWFTPDPNECKDIHFLCKNGNCVPQVAKCDMIKDCKDGSDENGCDDSTETKAATLETSSEESSSSSDSSNEKESSGEIDENELSIEKSTVFQYPSESEVTFTVKPTEGSSFSHEQLPSSTSYYEGRWGKETGKSSTQEISAPTSQPPGTLQTSVSIAAHTMSTRRRMPLSSSPVPLTRDYNNYSRPVNRYPPAKTYAKPSDPAHHPPTHINRPPIHNTNPPAYIRRPSKYDNRPSAYNRLPSTYDNRQLPYDRHSPPYGRHPSGYGIRPSTYGRAPTAYNGRSSNILNGEPDWRRAASLRPYKRETDITTPFYFAKDYPKLYGQRNYRHLREAKNWLLGQRDSSGSWGKDTPRALVALALTNGNFSKMIHENELMKQKFLVQLGINVLSNDSKEFNLNRMSMAMNALLAVCENPRDFHGIDLTEVLNTKILEYFKTRPRPYINPFIYLSLCLSGRSLGASEVQTLMKQMQTSPSTTEFNKDMQSIAIQAFACYAQQNSHDATYKRSLQTMLQNAVSDLLKKMHSDGSFGSVYSTSLAAQALISVNDSGSWNTEKTLNFLKQQQREDGSFGDLMATYYALPVISGRSLLHLRNIQCEPTVIVRDLTPSEILEFTGPRQYVHYSIYFNYPLTNSYSIRVLVPEGINLLDMMRVAEHQDNNFRFAYEEDDRNLHVYSVSGLPNDSELGLTWHLYVKREYGSEQYEHHSEELYSGDMRKYLPKSDDHVILWYHSNRR